MRTATAAESTFCLTRDAKFTNFCKITTRFCAWQRLSGETEEDGEQLGPVSFSRLKIQLVKGDREQWHLVRNTMAVEARSLQVRATAHSDELLVTSKQKSVFSR
jgi:hypothetical protein